MIIVRRRNPPPDTLLSDPVKKAKNKIETIVNSGKNPKSKDFTSHWGADDVRSQLWDMQYGKCCYCERKRDKKRESDIEHFRPKAKITGLPDDKPGYWWLAYEWDNLFFSCRACNQEYKKNHFPVRDEIKRACCKGDSLEAEQAYLINPETDNPDDFILYEWLWDEQFVFIRGREERGEETIKILGLNRETLLTERGQVLDVLKNVAWLMIKALEEGNPILIERRKSQILRMTSPKERFSGFRRYFFRQMGLGEYVFKN